MGVLSARQTRATVPLSNLPERTTFVDETVVPITFSGASSPTGSRCTLRSYKDANGIYWLQGIMEADGSPLDSDFDLILDNAGGSITFWSVQHQSVTASCRSSGVAVAITEQRANAGANSISIKSDSSLNEVWVEINVRLNAKPTWFDANREAGFSIAAQVDAFDGVSTGLMIAPTGLSDVAATMYGLKAYHHGTNYNGGNAPTITLSGGPGSLSSVEQCDIFPFQDQQGNWFANLSIRVTLSTTTRTEADIAIAGIDFEIEQAIMASHPSSSTAVHGNCRTQSGGQLRSRHGSASTNVYSYAASALALVSKPTWAY